MLKSPNKVNSSDSTAQGIRLPVIPINLRQEKF
jgi:hypothetical protein